nr:hypothetical protein [Tanacetum cinerariifolium]
MVVSLLFTVNLYHDGLFQVNLLDHCFKIAKNDEDLGQFVKACYENNLKIDLFIEHNGYVIIEMIHEDLHPKKPISHVDSDKDGEINVSLDDVAHVVKQIEHENMGKKPKIVDDDECETSKQGSKKADGRKEVNETLSKVVKEGWNKKKEKKKKRVNKDDLNLGDRGGLLQAIADWLPNAEHRQCARHIYANFKKRWRTNKGKCLLISKKRGRPVKNSASSSRGGSRGGASKRGRGSSKRGQDSNTIPFQGLRDEASDEEHKFNMDMEVVYGN